MTAPLSVQLYSLGGAPAADPRAVVERIADLGYTGVEPVVSTGTPSAMLEWVQSMGVGDMPSVDVAALKKALDEFGMVAESSHAQLPEGEMAQAILDDHELLGTTFLVVPALFDSDTMAMEAFDDLDRIKQLAERFNVASDLARSRGMRVGYHNHFWEFGTDFDGRSGLEVFYELVEPEVFAEVDVFWAQLGGRDPVELLRTLGERVKLLHVKDGDGVTPGAPSCPLGDGLVDIPSILAAGPSVLWNVVELEGLDEVAVWSALEQSHTYLSALAP